MWYNNKADHALPAYINSIHNAMLRAEVGAAKNYGIVTFVHPLLLTEEDLLLSSSGQMVADYGTVLILIAALGFLPSALMPYLIMERASEEKRVQMVGKAYVSFPGSYVYLRRSRQVYGLPVLPPRQPDNYIWSAVVVAVVLAVEQDISYLCHWRLYAWIYSVSDIIVICLP